MTPSPQKFGKTGIKFNVFGHANLQFLSLFLLYPHSCCKRYGRHPIGPIYEPVILTPPKEIYQTP